MPERLNIHCPSCNIIFDIPSEFCEKSAECTNCGQIFKIPPLETVIKEMEGSEVKSAEAVPREDEFDATKTGTIKFVRSSSFGMIPPGKRKSNAGYETEEFAIPPKAAQDAKKKVFRFKKSTDSN